jgi:polysaccharide chain length determinant protein (PEP-CTERM system associated)
MRCGTTGVRCSSDDSERVCLVNDFYRNFLFYTTFCWRYRWTALLTAWLVCLAGWTVVAFLPDRYVASGEIYIETQSVLQPLLRGLAVDSDVERQVALMQQTLLTRPNLEEVARRTDLDISVKSALEVDRLLDDLKRRITVAGAQKNLFSISVEDTVPQRAKETVDALVNIFVEGNLGQNRTDMDSAEKFLANQIEEYEAKLEEAERRLAAFKQINMGYLPAEGNFQRQLHDERRRLEDAEFALNDLLRKRNILQQELAAAPPILSGVASPDGRAARLAELQEALYNMLSKFTEQHPDVTTLRQEIQRLQTAGESWPLSSSPSGAAPGANGTASSLYTQLKLQLVEVDSDIAQSREAIARQRINLEKLENMAHRAPEIEAESTRLNRDYDVIKSQHDELLKRRESVRISQDRDAGTQLAKFRVVEPPQVPTVPEEPNRILLLTMVIPIGIAAGLMLAILLPLLRDCYFDVKRLRTDFGLAVLGAVSHARQSRLVTKSVQLTAFGGGIAALLVLYGLLLAVEAEAGLGTVASRTVATGSLEPVVNVLHRVTWPVFSQSGS